MALGLMAGVTAMHHHQVGEMVAQGVTDVRPVSQIAPEPIAQAPGDTAGPTVSETAAIQSVASTQPPHTEREDALLELLAEMRKEQKRLHKQMAETNRELAELTFTVDSHSDSFKPLRTDSQRPHTLTPMNGPQMPIGDDDSLLPPKPTPGR